MQASVRLENQAQAQARLEFLQGMPVPVLASALYAEAWTIMRASLKIVPFETGALAGSGDVSEPQIVGDRVAVVAGYGGAAEAYAVAQHERLDYRHAEGKSAKYLEKPMLLAARTVGNRMGAYIQAALDQFGATGSFMTAQHNPMAGELVPVQRRDASGRFTTGHVMRVQRRG